MIFRGDVGHSTSGQSVFATRIRSETRLCLSSYLAIVTYFYSHLPQLHGPG